MGFSVLLPFAAIFLLFAGITYFVTKLNAWKALPEFKSDSKCQTCGSNDLSERGLWGKESLERIYYCNACAAPAFRNKLPDLDN